MVIKVWYYKFLQVEGKDDENFQKLKNKRQNIQETDDPILMSSDKSTYKLLKHYKMEHSNKHQEMK